jgi:hypothetical protein
VTNDETGLTCPIDNPAALADCLRRLAADPALRTRLAESGHAAYRANFTREVVTERLMACYAEVLRLGQWKR